jgi:hypothetical protein
LKDKQGNNGYDRNRSPVNLFHLVSPILCLCKYAEFNQAGNGCRPSACPSGDPQYAQVFHVASTFCPQAEHLVSCNLMPQSGQKVKPAFKGKPQWAHFCPLAAGNILAAGANVDWEEC